MTTHKINLPLIFFSLTVFLCTIAELILLEIKYEFFSGGFGQIYQLVNANDIIIFLLSFFLLNLFLYGGSYLIWRYLSSRFNTGHSMIAFHFMMLSGIVTAIALVVQLELHKYFADAMDAALIKNIAGGDIKSALIYALDEMSMFIIGIFLLLGLYYFFYRAIRYILIKYRLQNIPYNKYRLNSPKYIFSGIIIASMLIVFINNNEYLRNNLIHTNSYTIISSIFDTVSDFDRDGYGSFRFPQDTKIFNSSIHPGALDIPNNGIDEDGFFGDFTSFKEPYGPYLEGQPLLDKPKHIIVILMESTRGDIISKKIDDITVAPNLLKIAREGQFITDAYSHTGYTASSLASFFSGTIGTFSKDKSLFPTLKSLGYHISIFSGQDESWGDMDIRIGTKKYADFFYDAQVGVEDRVFASRQAVSIKLSEQNLWTQFKKVSDNLDWSKPQFIYINMQASHFPYYHKKMTKLFVEEGIPRSKIKKENREWLERTYWNALNYADIYIGKITNELKDKGVWDDSLFIISGDHGEELFDNNHLGHGFFMSKVQTHIPLVINQRNFKITPPVGHSDMKPLILSYAVYGKEIIKKENKFVFQLIGNIDKPAKISLRYLKNKTISLNLKNMQVRPQGSKKWISYSTAINDAGIKSDLEKLIFHWENIRWKSHLEKQKINAEKI